MHYYKVPQELDGKCLYINNRYVDLVGNELFTRRECEKLGLMNHHLFGKFTIVKTRKIYTFFGARFEQGTDHNSIKLNGVTLNK